MMSGAEALRRMALDEEKLSREIERQSRGIVGSLTIEGDRGLFPMTRQRAARLTATRAALIGDAAHVYPPIGAQGLNLGLRDVEDLLGAISSARENGGDFGSAATLSAYEQARALDIAERMIAVNGLNASLTAHFAPVDALRGLGLAALRAHRPVAPPRDARRPFAPVGQARRPDWPGRKRLRSLCARPWRAFPPPKLRGRTRGSALPGRRPSVRRRARRA